MLIHHKATDRDHGLVAGEIPCGQNHAVVCPESDIFLFVIVSDEGHHPAGFVLFQVIAGDAVEEPAPSFSVNSWVACLIMIFV